MLHCRGPAPGLSNLHGPSPDRPMIELSGCASSASQSSEWSTYSSPSCLQANEPGVGGATQLPKTLLRTAAWRSQSATRTYSVSKYVKQVICPTTAVRVADVVVMVVDVAVVVADDVGVVSKVVVPDVDIVGLSGSCSISWTRRLSPLDTAAQVAPRSARDSRGRAEAADGAPHHRLAAGAPALPAGVVGSSAVAAAVTPSVGPAAPIPWLAPWVPSPALPPQVPTNEWNTSVVRLHL